MRHKLLPIMIMSSALLLSGCSIFGSNGSGSQSVSSENSNSGSSSSSSSSGSGSHSSSSSSEQQKEEPVLEEEQFQVAGTGNGWNSSSGTPVTSPRSQADYTILVYLCGSDLESYSSQYGEYGSMASKNLLEIMEVGIPSNINVVIETGGAKKSGTKTGWNNELLSSHQSGLKITDNTLERWHIENHKMVKDSSVSGTYTSMGAQDTFQSFLTYGLTNFPAKKTGVVMWDHGGAMMGCCQDQIKNDILSPFEMEAALDSALGSTKLEWIGYDCCLMDVADIASMNSEHFNYMVAAQETEPGEGWDYNGWLDDLIDDVNISTPSLLSEIADTFVEKCGVNYRAYGEYLIACGNYIGLNNQDEEGNTGADYVQAGQEYLNRNDATLAVLDLSKMAAFDTAWNALGASMKSKITSESNWNSFVSNVLEQSLRFGGTENYWGDLDYSYDVYDADDVFNLIKSRYSLNITSVTSAFNNLVIHNSYGASYPSSKSPSGLCVYIANASSASDFEVTSSNKIYSNWFDLYNEYAGSSYDDYGDWGW